MQLLLSRDLWRAQVYLVSGWSWTTQSCNTLHWCYKQVVFLWVGGGRSCMAISRHVLYLQVATKIFSLHYSLKINFPCVHMLKVLVTWYVTSKCAFWFINCLCLCMHTNRKYFCFAEIPALPPLRHDPESSEHSEQDSEWAESTKELKFKRPSGPRTHDPYASDDSWFMPITIAVAVFLPVLFCLCRVRWIITSFFLGCLVMQANHHRVYCITIVNVWLCHFLKYNSSNVYMIHTLIGCHSHQCNLSGN